MRDCDESCNPVTEENEGIKCISRGKKCFTTTGRSIERDVLATHLWKAPPRLNERKTYFSVLDASRLLSWNVLKEKEEDDVDSRLRVELD